jgi:hypothetical protein
VSGLTPTQTRILKLSIDGVWRDAALLEGTDECFTLARLGLLQRRDAGRWTLSMWEWSITDAGRKAYDAGETATAARLIAGLRQIETVLVMEIADNPNKRVRQSLAGYLDMVRKLLEESAS